MIQLTENYFSTLKERSSLIFQEQDSKKALLLGREIESALPQINDPALYQKYRTLVYQLKWLGLSLMQDHAEYLPLFKNYFIEGLLMPEGDLNGPTQIITQKLSAMFGIGATDFLNNL